MNEHIVIIALALLIFYLAFGGRAGGIAAGFSAVMMVGALRHPEIATSKAAMAGTPEEQLQVVMLLVALLIFPRLLWGCVAAFKRGGR